MPTKGLWRAARALLALVLLWPGSGYGEDSAPEAALKAAFIFNFSKFVDWPATTPGGPLRLCLAGSNGVTDALVAFDGKQTLGRTLTLVPLPRWQPPGSCQMIYFADTNPPRQTAEWLAELKGKPILTVSDLPDFLNLGGMIAIVRSGDRLRFDVDLGSTQAAELKIGSPLLRMAKTVRQ